MFIRSLQTRLASWVGMCLVGLPSVLASSDAQANSPRWISTTVFFENENACMWAGIDEQTCQSAQRTAYRQHVRIAPAYRNQTDCESDFADQTCVFSVDSDHWTPWLSGFSLTTRIRLPLSSNELQRERQIPMAYMRQRWTHHAGGADAKPDATARVQYFSEPLYWEHAAQGGSRLTTLRDKLRIADLPDNASSSQTPGQSNPASSNTRQVTRHAWPQRLTDINAR